MTTASITIQPDPAGGSRPDTLPSLPTDLLEQVRGRVRLLALLLFTAFAFDGLLWVVRAVAVAAGYDVVVEPYAEGPVAWINLAGMCMSGAVWAAARSARVSPARLHTIGLTFEVAICFFIAYLTNRLHYGEFGIPPNLTWVPAMVILFPLLLPGPPVRMLVAACLAGATVPVSLVLLDVFSDMPVDADAYFGAIVPSAFAIGFAYVGARIVYGLGREVAAAREMGSYVLEEKLGEGGMGEVWRARHRLLARPAAVKLIRTRAAMSPGALVGDARRRFEREAQATAALRSPHTVDVFDFGVARDGSFYYVMELLEGLTADVLVSRFGALPAARVIYLLGQLCHSLSEAESRGLVHRDIKPANVYVCRYGEDCDFVKVLDFGLVKAFGDSVETSPALTMDHTVAGTPAFMAPEQASGGLVDSRADIYATGCVAYWLLTGRTVFEAETAMGMVLEHARGVPAPPSARTELPVPPALDALILRCLAKSPGDRPASAAELGRELSRIDVAPAWTAVEARAWWDAHVPAPAPRR